MKTITIDLLRKRAEHNEGELSTLKEITLHQFDLERIDVIQDCCRQLEILFLQNNQIQKIENLGKLKALRYLNFALNNVKRIENLQGCESLQKLDFTVNFIEDLTSIESLKDNIHLRELFLVGNPCTDIIGYRLFVIHTLPQLKVLDGKDIERSERIVAAQEYESVRQALAAKRELQSKNEQEAEERSLSPDALPQQEDQENLESRRNRFQQEVVPHTAEARLQAAKDVEDFQEDGKAKPKSGKPKKEPRKLVGDDGRILQCNEGKYPFKFEYSSNLVVLIVDVSKFMDTSLIDVQVETGHVRVVIKDKTLQLLLDDMVVDDQSLCERSKYTGQLVITMLKRLAPIRGDVETVRRIEREEDQKRKKLEKAKKAEAASFVAGESVIQARLARLKVDVNESGGSQLDWKNIVSENPIQSTKRGILDKRFIRQDLMDDDFEDNPDVPPLC